MVELQTPLDYNAAPLNSLGLYTRRLTGSVVGRSLELAAVEREFAAALRGLVCLTIEGEPGIGKTRLLLAIEELARQQGFIPVGVTADEEIRGPFLLARGIFGSLVGLDSVSGDAAKQALQRVVDALSALDDPSLQSLAPDRKLVRVFDLAAVAVRALAAERPLAILVDDMQWADEDSLRLLRYVVRTDAASRLLLVLATRPDETAFVNEAVTLLADVERMGFLRRLKLARFGQLESADFLQQVLGGRINLSSAAVMHAQSEGVPFILAEQAQAYRDAGMLQQIDGVWTLARNAERLLPSAVRTLIQRRAAHLPEDTKAHLAEAAVLGRSFSLRDLRDIKARLNDAVRDTQPLAESLAPAVAVGLLIQHPQGSPADYSFTHDRVREYSAATLSPPRRRALHEAIVQMLTAGGQPAPGSLPLLAQHALAAGRSELCARSSIEAARNALQLHAPEEVLRLVALAQPVASSAQDRVALLQLQDDALDMLRRPAQRLEGLAQLAAMAEALGDSHLEMEVLLRRAAALRLSRDYDGAAELARRVRQLAAQRGDAPAELAACLELGQDILHSELGEGFVYNSNEVDLDAAAAAFECALALAEQLGDEPRLAAASRELGVIATGRIRAWFVARVQAGEHIGVLRQIASGAKLEDMLPTLPIAPLVHEADSRFRRALEIYQRLGDRQGAMSTIIALAYVSWAPEIHLPGSAKRIEEIRRLVTRLQSLTKESDRALADTQMLYGAQVYARAKGLPDAALAKGEEAYNAARALGERSLEFAAAGGLAMSHAEMGSITAAERWLARAAEVASAAPTPLRARLLESWRGSIRALAGDPVGLRQHLERAVQLATEQGHPAARCEALALLALEAARLGAQGKDEPLLALAQRSALDARALVPLLPGHPPWDAQAQAALARVALARRDLPAAAAAGRAALAALDAALREDLFLDILLPAAEAILAAGAPDEAAAVRDRLRLLLELLVPRVLDQEVRVRWLRGPVGSELARLAGPLSAPAVAATPQRPAAAALSSSESALMDLLVQGRTNAEIAQELAMPEDAVARQLVELFARMGVLSRADATASAIMGKRA